MKKLFILSFILMFSLLNCSTESKKISIQVPDSIFAQSANAKTSPLGLWRYANHQYFEFKGSPDSGTWTNYINYGNKQKFVQFSGKWSVFKTDQGINYLKLDYEKIGLDKTDMYPFKRVQVVEYYVDDNYFAMNIYRKKDKSADFMGEWLHTNYDWFDDAYFWGDAPLWKDMESFQKKILSYVKDPNDKKFIEEDCYTLKAGKYVKNLNLSEQQEFRLEALMKLVKEQGGYSGEWFHTPFSSIPKKQPYYINRLGKIVFKQNGSLKYTHESPFFTVETGSVSQNLPDLTRPVSNPDVEVDASYNVVATPLFNKEGKTSGEEVILRFTNSSNNEIVGEWQFSVKIIKDKGLLLTYPFLKIN